MFVNDIFKKQLNETVLNPRDPQGDYDAKRKVIHDLSLDPAVDQQAVQQRRLDLDKEAKAKGLKEQGIEEAGPFSYGAKKPRKGSVADLAAQKRKEQDRKTPAIEPKDQQVGVARVVKEYGDTPKGQKQLTRVHKRAVDRLIKADDKNMLEPDYTKRDLKTVRKNQATADRAWDRMTDLEEQGVAEGTDEGLSKYSTERLQAYVKKVSGGGVPAFGSGAKLKRVQAELKRREQGVAEGSAQDKLYKRHQELRKKSGLPDPDYYKELKASYDLPDQDRYAKQKEIKQKYKVTNEDREQYIEELGRAGYEIVTEKRMTCPECGGAAYEDKMLAEKQDACYHKVKSRYKVWPSAYASGALVRCRKKGAKNWGNKSK